ncbi:cyclic nucleotide-gated channel beta-1-like [Equus caballus]|uniref:cyclic nucleotide-gated channel beta-1-like n=1 Tax=Equus caballus TaxID=9796 RepID=UPI0038B39CC2
MGKRTFVDPSKPRLPSHTNTDCSHSPPPPPSSLLPPPFPSRPCCQQVSAAIVSLVAAIFVTVMKPPDQFSQVEAECCVSPTMSDIEKGSPDLGGQNRARGGVGQDPRSTESAELGAEVARAAYPGDFQAIVQAHVEEEVWLDIPEVIIENWDVQQVEEEWVPGEEEAVGEEEDEQEEGEAEEVGEEDEEEEQEESDEQERENHVDKEEEEDESVSFFAKEVAEYKYGNSEEEAQEAGGEEEDEREEPEEGLEMDMDCAEGSPGESSPKA